MTGRARPRVGSTRAARLAVVVTIAATVLLLSSTCDSDPVAPPADRSPRALVPRYTDLLRLDASLPTGIWSLDGDTRVVLPQTAPARSVLGPVPPGRACSLRFGLGLSPRSRARSSGVAFRAWIDPPLSGGDHAESPAPGPVEVFSSVVVPEEETESRWLDQVVEIGDQALPFTVVLEVDPGPGGDRTGDNGGWSAPHVVCEVPIERRRSRPPGVVLVSIDTLRRDHLGLYGYERDTSPVLDALAGESVVYEEAISTASYTLPSHASLFTGLHPDRHGAGHRFPEAPLAEDLVTLAELLSSEGFRTIGFSGGGMVSARLGLDQGFEEWTERQRANLRSMLPAVLDALFRVRNDPFLLFLHTYDVHAPYEQPADARVFVGEPRGLDSAASLDRARALEYHRHHDLSRFSSIEEVVAAYDSGIRWADTHVGLLLGYLDEIGLLDSTTVVVTSDHGESLFERGRYFGHSQTLEDQEIRIPLLVRWPGGGESARRKELIQITALPGLLLEHLGIPAERLTGQLGTARPAEERSGLAWGEASHTGARFVRSRGWKIVTPTAPYWEARRSRLFRGAEALFPDGWQVFDLARDPHETTNLATDSERVAAALAPLLRQLQSLDPPGAAAETPPDRSLEADLRALGYL